MSSSKKQTVSQMIQDLGLQPSHVSTLRKDMFSFLMSKFDYEQTMLDVMLFDDVRSTHIQNFLNSEIGETWFNSDTGRQIGPKSADLVRDTMSNLVKYWVKRRTYTLQHPKAADTNKTSASKFKSYSQISSPEPGNRTVPRKETSPMLLISDDEDEDQSGQPQSRPSSGAEPQLDTVIDDLPELSDILASPARLKTTTTVPMSRSTTPQASEQPHLTPSAVIEQQSPSIVISEPSPKAPTGRPGLLTPPSTVEKRKRPSALECVNWEDIKAANRAAHMPLAKRARFASPPVATPQLERVSSDTGDQPMTDIALPSTQDAESIGANESCAAIIETLHPANIEVSVDCDEQQTTSDTEEDAMNKYHVPWTLRGGGESALMSIEALRNLPARLLDCVRDCENYHWEEANKQHISDGVRERHFMKHKLMRDLKQDLEFRVNASLEGSRPNFMTFYAQCH